MQENTQTITHAQVQRAAPMLGVEEGAALEQEQEQPEGEADGFLIEGDVSTPPQEPPPPAWLHAQRQYFAGMLQHRAKYHHCTVPTKGEWLAMICSRGE
jgi:hypothetical protein